MIQTIKQNKKAVLAFLLALVMLIGLIPFTATEVQAVTIPVGDITTNDSFGNGDTWQDGDQIKIERTVGYDSDCYTYTASVDENGITTWALDKKLYWDGKEEHILAAFYPAAGQDDYRSFELPEDQSTLEKLKLADCMNAVWVGNPTTDPINFQMKHRLSMVTVNYEFASEFTNATVDNVKVIPSDPFVMFDAEDGGKMDEPYGVFGTTIDAYHDAENKTIQAIVIPCTYPEGQLFMTLEVNGEELQVKMPEAKTLEEGTHYSFDLKVGKDVVTIEQVSVNGNVPSITFSEGWNNEKELDDGSGSITDTQDEGKTAWDNGDQIIATLTSQYYGEQTATLTHDGINWAHPEDMTFKYLENETPAVKAVYAPSNVLGTDEYIEFDCELNGAELTVKLESSTRNYSRLRIVGLPNKTLTVTTTKFTPAGATSAATAPYTLTTDENGNAFLYGTFAEGATISVKQGDVVLKEYAFTANKHPGGTEHGMSYVLGVVPVIDGTLGGKTEATEDDINALVEQLKTYVDNGITTIIVPGTEHAMYDSALGMIPAYAEALYLLTDNSQEESQYRGTIDLILPDATEIIDYSFDSVDALKSITLPKVTTVGDRGFWACYYLETLTFGSVVTNINDNSGQVFYDLGYEIGGCNLVLNAEQANAATEYQPNVETKTWWNTEWKSITLE